MLKKSLNILMSYKISGCKFFGLSLFVNCLLMLSKINMDLRYVQIYNRVKIFIYMLYLRLLNTRLLKCIYLSIGIFRPDIATILIGATRLIATMLASTAVERTGRRFLLMLSTAFCAVSMVRLALCLSLTYVCFVSVSRTPKIRANKFSLII